MTTRAESPFRQEDEAARLEALRERRASLRAELDRVEGEIARLRPWSWKHFVLGLLLLPGILAVVVIARL